MWGLALLTFGLPWIRVAGVENPYLEPKALWLTVVGWGLLLWRFFRLPDAGARWRTPWSPWLSGWVGGTSCWRFQCRYLSRSPGQSRIIYNEYAWFAAIGVLMGLLLVQSLATVYLRSDLLLHRLTQWMCWMALAASGYGLCQAIGWDQWYVQTHNAAYANRVSAGFGNPGYLGIYLALILPLFFLFSDKRYLLYALPVLLVLWLTQARYAWVGALLGILASVTARWWTRLSRWGQRGVVVAWFLMMGGIAVAGWPWLQSDEVRLPLWSSALATMQNVAGETPKAALSMTGYGLNSLPLLLGESARWAHNEWVQMCVEIGVVGTLLLAGMVVWSLWRGWKAATQSLMVSGWFGVWVAFVAISFVHFPAHIAPIAWVGMCAWAVVEREGALHAGCIG